MQAVIMAGGKGTRLAEITKNEIPKPMVPLAGKPLLEWQIEVLKENGIFDICMVIGYLGTVIKQYFGTGERFGVSIFYVEEEKPMGTAGALYYIKEWLKEQQFLLVFGDILFQIDLKRMLQYHLECGAEATVFAHPNSHPYDSDILELDQDNRVIGFQWKGEKRTGWYHNCVNAGVYILDAIVCRKITYPQKMDLEKDVLAKKLLGRKKLFAYRSPEYSKDVGTVERIRAAEEEVNKELPFQKCLTRKQRCIFLDRDGTINRYHGLVYREKDFILEEGVEKALALLNRSAWLGIVVTNQPVVARGLCSIEEVDQIHKKMETQLGEKGVYVDGVKFCPHHPDRGYPEENPTYKIDCNCRKPKIGLITQSAEKYNIDLSASWIIGDSTVDIQTGKNAGMKTALVRTGMAGNDGKYKVEPDLVGNTLFEIVKKIIEGGTE